MHVYENCALLVFVFVYYVVTKIAGRKPKMIRYSVSPNVVIFRAGNEEIPRYRKSHMAVQTVRDRAVLCYVKSCRIRITELCILDTLFPVNAILCKSLGENTAWLLRYETAMFKKKKRGFFFACMSYATLLGLCVQTTLSKYLFVFDIFQGDESNGGPETQVTLEPVSEQPPQQLLQDEEVTETPPEEGPTSASTAGSEEPVPEAK